MTVDVLMADSDILSFPVEGLGEEEDLLRCKHCDNTFNKKKALKKHMRKSHFRVDDTADDEDDIEIQKEMNRAKFECNYCESTFRKERNLTLHIREDHGGDSVKEKDILKNGDSEHSGEDTVSNTEVGDMNKELQVGSGEDLLVEDDGADQVVIDTEGIDVEGAQFELDGNSLALEDIHFDIDQSGEPAGDQDQMSKTTLESPDGDSAAEIEIQAEETSESCEQTEIEGLPSEETLELGDESIVMDDEAFELLENAMQMTMSTPDDSDEEDVPLSSRKRKVKTKSRVSKRSKRMKLKKGEDAEEIVMDGEPVVLDLDSSTDDDDIVVIDEVNIEQKDDGGNEESEPEDDNDPDFIFTPNKKKKGRKESSGSDLRKSNRKKNKQSNKTTPPKIVEEKVFTKGKTRISIVPSADSVPALKTIPKSTRVVFNSGSSQAPSINLVSNERSNPKGTVHQPAKKLLCSICRKIFLSRDQFNSHMLKDHRKETSTNVSGKEQKKLPCGKCPKYFDKKSTLEEHVKESHNHKCAKCRQKFDTQEALNSHMRTHLIKCDKCNFTADTKLKILEHKKAAHNFRCSKCRHAFDQKDKLEAHIKANHYFRCGKCNVTFDDKNLIEEHNKKNHYFPCGSCNKVFDMRQRLATHDKAAHQSCDVCEDEFSWPEPDHACYYTKNNIRPVIKC